MRKNVAVILWLCLFCARMNAEQCKIKLNDSGTSGEGTAVFKNLNDAPGTFTIEVSLPRHYVVVKDGTSPQSPWTKTSDLSGKATVDSPLRNPEFFGVALKGEMYIPGDGPGNPIAWTAKAGSFYIHSTAPEEKYDKVVVAWGKNVTFTSEAKEVKVENPVKWTVTKDGGGDGNVPELDDGRTLTIGAEGADGENPVEPGTYTVTAKDKNGLQDSMELVIARDTYACVKKVNT